MKTAIIRIAGIFSVLEANIQPMYLNTLALKTYKGIKLRLFTLNMGASKKGGNMPQHLLQNSVNHRTRKHTYLV